MTLTTGQAPVTPSDVVPTTPELLYLVAGDPNELAQAVATARSADVAEALNALPPAGAAQVMAALPFDLAVGVLDEPELQQLAPIFERLNERYAGPLVEAMAPDRRADLFQALPERERLILKLRFEDELLQHQIAERIGISQMHVSRLIRRSLDRMREQLA